MNLGRIGKLFFTFFLGQGITVITQLIVPPFFLRFYHHGVAVYGEWILLSAAVSYLGTLNYGIQTYASNQMTILHNGGDAEGAKTIQASAIRLLLIIIAAFAAIGGAIFFIPIASLLHLQYVSQQTAALTLFLLIMQFAIMMLFTLLTNSFMMIGQQHRGNYWTNGQRLFSVLCLAAAIWLHGSFAVLAGVQLAALILFLLLALIDVKVTAPILMPSLRYGNWQHVGAILKPSGHFGLISLAGFLTWQGPVILIHQLLGAEVVGAFALVRMVFQMSRQVLSIASYTIGQDITLLVGERNWTQLRRLYDLSERIVMFLIPIVSIGSLLMCPVIFTVWLHKRDLYSPLLCFLMAILSAILGIKEHKTQFQSSSNSHEKLSVFILAGYSIMLAVSVVTMHFFGLTGFVITWMVWEVIQTAFVLRLNHQLFPEDLGLTQGPMLRLTAFMAVAFAIAAAPTWYALNWPLGTVIGVTAALTCLFAGAGYFVFGLDELRNLLTARLRSRYAPST